MREKTWDRTRIRLNRLYDAKFFNGYVISASEPTIAIRLYDSGDLGPGDECMVHVYGKTNVVFQANCINVVNHSCTLEMMSPPVEIPAYESVRLVLHEVMGLLFINQRMHRVEIADVGVNGVGVYFDRQIPIGTEVMIELDTEDGRVRMICETRYSRKDQIKSDMFRIGFRILSSDPTSQRRWEAIFRDVA